MGCVQPGIESFGEVQMLVGGLRAAKVAGLDYCESISKRPSFRRLRSYCSGSGLWIDFARC